MSGCRPRPPPLGSASNTCQPSAISTDIRMRDWSGGEDGQIMSALAEGPSRINPSPVAESARRLSQSVGRIESPRGYVQRHPHPLPGVVGGLSSFGPNHNSPGASAVKTSRSPMANGASLSPMPPMRVMIARSGGENGLRRHCGSPAAHRRPGGPRRPPAAAGDLDDDRLPTDGQAGAGAGAHGG